MSLVRAAATVGGMTMISRFTGFVRDMLIARLVGAGVEADAFFVAFKLPNLFRRLFAEGAFNAAFIPLFTATMEEQGKTEALRFAGRSAAVLGMVLLLLSVVMMAGMPWVIQVFAPGFADIPGKQELAAALARITFPYLLFVALVSLQAGVLNALDRFAAAAAAPVLLNLCLIGGLLVLAPWVGGSVYGLAWGVSIAGVLQLLWLMLALHHEDAAIPLLRPKLTPRIKLLVKRIVPGAVGAGVYQVNLVVDTILASMVANGAVSWLYLADRINQLPLGVVGIAVSTAMLPALTRSLRRGEAEASLELQNRALELALLLTVPAATALVLIATPLIRVLFGGGAFLADDVTATAAALQMLALGLPAYVLIKVVAPGFFAREDTATPVKVAVVAMLVNVVLAVLLMGPLGHVGIALATAVAAWVNMLVLGLLLAWRGGLKPDMQLLRRGLGIGLASAAMGSVLSVILATWAPPESTGLDALRLLVLVLAGGASYAVAVLLCGGASVQTLRNVLRRRAPVDPG